MRLEPGEEAVKVACRESKGGVSRVGTQRRSVIGENGR